jgi:predicted amidohydrolase
MKIACCQFDIAWEQKQTNHDRVATLLRQAELPAGSLVLLPEMFATGFSMNVAEIEDGQDHATQAFLTGMSRELKFNILAGIVSLAPNGTGYNEAIAVDPQGKETARYQKLHPFSFGGENKHYTPGGRIVTFGWSGFCVCPLICYDLRFPEPFRVAVKRGADCFAVIANWPAAREQHWVTLLQARAIENQSYVAAVNRCGSDPTLQYSGRSVIIDARGTILADAGGGPGVISADVDHAALLRYRKEFPVLNDIRNDYDLQLSKASKS